MKEFGLLAMTLTVCLVLIACGRSNDEKPDLPERKTGVADTLTYATPVENDFEIDENAPFISEKHPNLASSGLMHARLDELPEGVLLRAGSVIIKIDELDEYVNQASPKIQDELRKSAFFVLEQLATDRLLLDEVKKSGITGRDDNAMIKAFADNLIESVEVDDDEIKNFYDANMDMMDGMPFDRAEPKIRRHLRQEKQQDVIRKHIEEMGKRFPVAVSRSWTEQQAELAADNPVDKARASGKPSFVSFGADECMPCQKMKPFREEINEKYGDRLNVVYIHVNEDQILSARYGVQGIPHVIFFDADGKEVYARGGFMSMEQIEEWLEKIGIK